MKGNTFNSVIKVSPPSDYEIKWQFLFFTDFLFMTICMFLTSGLSCWEGFRFVLLFADLSRPPSARVSRVCCFLKKLLKFSLVIFSLFDLFDVLLVREQTEFSFAVFSNWLLPPVDMFSRYFYLYIVFSCVCSTSMCVCWFFIWLSTGKSINKSINKSIKNS